jgi:hypothetical protein
MKFKYTGDEFTEVFGLQWKTGETQDVASEYAANKLKFHPLFEPADAKDKPKAGDVPKALKPELGLDVTVQKVIQRTNAVISAEIARAEKTDA